MSAARIATLLLLLAGLALAGCGAVEVGLGTPGAEPPQPTATAEAPSPEPTQPPATPAPTATAAADQALPGAVYFISTGDKQIWRVEPNGRTLTQVTTERAAVDEFDLSPAGDAIAYVAENLLVRANVDGTGRTVLVTGPALTGAIDEGVNKTIRAPRWSPDGQTIAYGLNGANLVAAGGGEPQMLQASDPVPQTRSLARFYRPYAWSPDGTRLVLQFNYWMEGGGYMVKNLADGTLLELNACCQPVWSRDGQNLYFWSTSTSGMDPAGLWRVSAATGEVTTLIANPDVTDPGTTALILAGFPHEGDDGLYWLQSEAKPNADGVYLWPEQFQVMRAAPEAAGQPEVLRPETHTAMEALWAPGARGVVVREIDPNSMPELHGALVWLPTDGSPALTLPADGTNLRWGK